MENSDRILDTPVLDRTLLDTLDDLTASVNYCMGKYGAPVYDRERVRAKAGNRESFLISA